MPSARRLLLVLAISIPFLLYLSLRLGFKDAVMFDYDMPQLAFSVLSFMENGTFATSYDFVRENHWGSFSWGPLLHYYYAPFFLLSRHPLTVSLLVGVFNIVSI